MKKNISINISGIIFHIEEDGYENLRRYLDSITKYFSTFEDSSEIMADIESRIAEIFLSKLNEGKQIITADDVNALVTTMGSVSDFKAVEEQEFTQTGAQQPPSPGTQTSGTTDKEYTYAPPKHLARDQKRKILGGVCAGLANYMNVDTVWIRLLFALLAFAWGFTIFVYIIMWIVVPGAYDLAEVDVNKKMFRDPDRKVLGGVSGGVASYLKIDILAVRVLFVLLTIVGGLGLFVYIILWVILPEAKTLTDRMQMQGEAVTLSNIESNIKKNMASDPDREESTITKILLFPFRLLGILLQALARIIVPIVEVLRVAIGIMVVLVGISFAFATIVAGGVAVGVFSSTAFTWGSDYHELGVPLHAFSNAFPGWLAVGGFIAALIPAIFIILLGVSIVARRIIFSATVGWSLFVLFFVCVAILSVGIPKSIYAFKEYGEYKVETEYKPAGKTAVLTINEVGLEDYHGSRMELKGHSEPTFKLVQVFTARGSTRPVAIENAKMVTYNARLADSTLTFDSNITFKPDAIFRSQYLNLTLYVPYNYPFVMDKAFTEFLNEYVNYEYRDGYTWNMTEKGLECITCPKPSEEELAKADLVNFNELDLHGIFDVHVYRGDNYAVELSGPEAEKKKYNIYRSGETLVVDFEGKKNFNWDWNFDKVMQDEVRINITMPSLEGLEATGFGKVHFDEFHNSNMEISIRGPIKLRGNLHTDDLVVNLSGKSKASLKGRATKMNAEIEFVSELEAYDLEVNEAVVETNGASRAEVHVTNILEMDEGVGCDIDFRGTPQVIKPD